MKLFRSKFKVLRPSLLCGLGAGGVGVFFALIAGFAISTDPNPPPTTLLYFIPPLMGAAAFLMTALLLLLHNLILKFLPKPGASSATWRPAGLPPDTLNDSRAPHFSGSTAAGYCGAAPAVHPWRRLIARSVDLWILSVSLGLLVALAGSHLSLSFGFWLMRPGAELVLGWLLLPAVLLAEAALYAAVGTTPGKALLGLRVVTAEGTRPRLAQYLRRQLGVYWYGLGTGLPLVNLCTAARQYHHLRKHRLPTYDRGAFNVEAVPLGTARGFAVAAALGLMLFAGGVLKHYGRQIDQQMAKGSVWTNEVTGLTAEIPSGWVHEAQKNEDGEPITVFSNPEKGVILVFAREYTDGTLTLEDYAEQWRSAVDSNMVVQAEGERVRIAGLQAWQGQGVMRNDLTRKISATFISRGDQIWRMVVVTTREEVRSHPTIERVKQVLAATLSVHAEKPQPWPWQKVRAQAQDAVVVAGHAAGA